MDRIEEALVSAGIEVWRDVQMLWGGDDWKLRIKEAIEHDALVVLAVFSDVAIRKVRSYQREEILLAISTQRMMAPGTPFIIPVRLEDCLVPTYEISSGRLLSDLTWIDLFPDLEQGIKRLVASVARLAPR